MRSVVLAHGLEGRPDGTKATALREAGLRVVCPDHRGLVLAPRVASLVAVIRAHPGCVLVGSSYGGLAAMAALGEVHPLVAELVLLAPALHWSEPPVDDPSTLRVPACLPAWVVHGVDDTVVPVAVSEALAARSEHVVLHKVRDGHLLKGALADIVAGVAARAQPTV